jgi:hypothetical protein
MPPDQADPQTDELVQRQVRLLERVIDTCLIETSKLSFDPDSLPQMVAVALHGTILELAHACGSLVQSTDYAAIPILMRPMLEASVDQDNLLGDAEYVKNMEAADLARFVALLEQSVPGKNPFLKGLSEQHDVRAGLIERHRRIAELEAEGRASLKIFERFKRAKREDEYRSVYPLLSLDSHNNFSALSERHFGELANGEPTLSFFKPPEVATLRSRLDAVTGMALGSALSIHSAFRTSTGAFASLAVERKSLQTLVIEANSKARQSAK